MRSYEVVEFRAPLKVTDRPTPKPAGSEVLVRTLAAGVCHSDIHIWEGEYDLGGGKKLNVRDRGMTPPFTMGHEIVGEVVALGPEAEGAKIGDKRLVFPWLGCGSCAVCRRGEEQLCLKAQFLGVFRPGGYADHIIAPHARYLLDIGTLDPVEAAPYACSGLTAYGALKRVGPLLEEEPVVVIGAGGLGLMCINILKAMGGRGAIVVDTDATKREAALKAGALAAIDGKAADAVKQVQAAAGGGIWAAIDFVGASGTVRLAVDSLTKGGKAIVVGLFGGDITLPTPFIPMRAMTLQGSYVGSLAEATELLALVKRARIPAIPITRRPLDGADAALQDLRAGRLVGRAVLVP